MTVLAATPWRTNAELVGAVRDLGYIGDDDQVLDATYGLGRWWTIWRPTLLIGTDLDPAKSQTGDSVDFRALPFDAGSFDVVCLDPPYRLNGTPDLPFDAGYGIAEASRWQDRHQLIRDGIDDCARVLRAGGRLLLKCQDQVCSGRVRWQTLEFANHAAGLGLELVDRLDMLGHRPQPPGRRQVHARRNYSTLLVLRKGGAR